MKGPTTRPYAPMDIQPLPTQTRRRRAFPCLITVLTLSTLTMAASRADPVPSSVRSRAVTQRVAPQLSKALEARSLRLGAPVFLRIFKESKELEVWVERETEGPFRLYKTYPIAALSGRLGPKLREGDRQAPEGFYEVGPKSMNPNSRFHLSFNLGYPNAFDRAHGRTGSYLMIHGGRVSIGCYAMTDPGIEEIYTLVEAALRNGQDHVPVHCFPFRVTEKRLAQAQKQRAERAWLAFWNQLAEADRAFHKDKRPPAVRVVGQRYVIASDS